MHLPQATNYFLLEISGAAQVSAAHTMVSNHLIRVNFPPWRDNEATVSSLSAAGISEDNAQG